MLEAYHNQATGCSADGQALDHSMLLMKTHAVEQVVRNGGARPALEIKLADHPMSQVAKTC